MVSKAPKNQLCCHLYSGAVLYIGFSYLNILFQFFQEHLFVVVININLLALINKIVIFQGWQFFGLKQMRGMRKKLERSLKNTYAPQSCGG